MEVLSSSNCHQQCYDCYSKRITWQLVANRNDIHIPPLQHKSWLPLSSNCMCDVGVVRHTLRSGCGLAIVKLLFEKSCQWPLVKFWSTKIYRHRVCDQNRSYRKWFECLVEQCHSSTSQHQQVSLMYTNWPWPIHYTLLLNF